MFGAGLATTIINFGMFAAALWFAYGRRPFKKYRVLGRFWRLDWALMRRLIAIGGPHLRRLPAGVWPVRRGGALDGPDRDRPRWPRIRSLCR